ncbi:MAG: RloB domain-containing protein [Thermoguttaceae bacterium]|nr:RloB domain-containing protein [Thermoguttaceae bacterium]
MKPRLGTKRPLASISRVGQRDSKLFVIAVEGEVTEDLYFKECVVKRNPRVLVKVLPTKDHKTSPEYVLKRLQEKYNEDFISRRRNRKDEYWLVVDVDNWEELSDILEKTEKAGFQHAVSNPRFEVWLALYSPKFRDSPKARQRLKESPESIISEHINTEFQKSRINPTHYQNHELAIQNAQALDRNPDAQIPEAPGSRVYRLVNAILNSK